MTRADINAATSSPQHMSRMRFADLRDRFADSEFAVSGQDETPEIGDLVSTGFLLRQLISIRLGL